MKSWDALIKKVLKVIRKEVEFSNSMQRYVAFHVVKYILTSIAEDSFEIRIIKMLFSQTEKL